MPPGGNGVLIGYLNLLSFERVHELSKHAKYDVSISYDVKVLAKEVSRQKNTALLFPLSVCQHVRPFHTF